MRGPASAEGRIEYLLPHRGESDAALRAKGRVVIEIEKRLPVQGGLGGASANAVATLLGLERALKKSLPAAERLRIAAEVGSDLPLFLVGRDGVGSGAGGAGVSAGGFAGDGLRGGDAGGGRIDSEGVCGVGYAGAGAKAQFFR